MAEPTQAQLEEMVVGKPQKPTAVFFEKAVLDVAASNEAGRRIYTNEVYVLPQQSGVRDSVSYKATPEDIKSFPEAWELFQRNRQGVRKSPPVQIIPGVTLVEAQELFDMGLDTVEKLASANTVPPHLRKVHERAVKLNVVLEEQYNASEEESSSEESSSAEAVFASDRLEHPRPVGRPEIPPGVGHRGEVAGGLRPGGREHHREGQVTPRSLDNWSIEFTL